jgi:MFS family permease
MREAPVTSRVLGMRTYRELFSLGEFRVLFTTTSLNVAAGSVASLALGTLAYRETGSPLLSSFVMFGGPLVRLCTSWFLLSLADLWRPRTAMALAAGVGVVADLAQAIPDMAMAVRIVVLVVPWILLSAMSGSMVALVADIVPEGSFVFARATMNIAVGVMQIVGYGTGGLLLLAFSTSQLFLGAAACSFLALLLVRFGLGDHPPRATGRAVQRSKAVNGLLLRSPVLRPVYLSLWVPNGLVVGCEALIVPYAGSRAGFLFAATALGMLAGDVLMGRVIPPRWRDRLVEPARFLLAVPWLFFVLHPGIVLAFLLSAVASVGYCASLPLQERLVTRTAPDIRGHTLGLHSLGMMSMQGVGALLAGGVATLLGSDSHAAGLAIGVMAAASVLVTLSLVPGLQRSRAGSPVEVLTLPPRPVQTENVGSTAGVHSPFGP